VRHRPELETVLRETAEVLGRTGTAPSIRFQQTSGMVMAKGVEDTAFYRWTRLTSLTEVGAEPDEWSVGIDEFHELQRHRTETLPFTMTTLSTHDTKRSEDTRARISVLAEIPEGWAGTLSKIRSTVPIGDGSFENLLWQALVGAWPLSRERAQDYATKASREAGDSTGWLDVDEEFEKRMSDAIDTVFDDPIARGLIEGQVAAVRSAGRSNSLSEKLVQLTTTGVPDVYQGTEFWDHSLVDPDNRRDVDFDERSEALALQDTGELPSWTDTAEDADDLGAVKLLVVSAALRLRRDRPELFESYTPLEARGSAERHAVAFDRGGAITLATRLPLGLARQGGWDDTIVVLPPARNGYVDTFTGRIYAAGDLRLADAFATYPVALLQKIEES